MTINPLKKAIKNAETANGEIGKLFAIIGNAEHPRGIVPTAYRNARRAMKSALAERFPAQGANEVMLELKATIRTGMFDLLTKAEKKGRSFAEAQLSDYQLPLAGPDPVALQKQVIDASAGIVSVIDQQASTIQSMLTVGVDTARILGDSERVGLFRVGDVISAAAFWTSTLVWSSFSASLRPSDKERIKKLAVAAIDQRTTDCCLRVHGQVQPFKDPFRLTGTPRYADELDWSPFHRYCRTSIALYYDEYDDGITDWMKQKANTLLTNRTKP